MAMLNEPNGTHKLIIRVAIFLVSPLQQAYDYSETIREDVLRDNACAGPVSYMNGLPDWTELPSPGTRVGEKQPVRRRWYVRMPVKLLIFSAVTLFVLFPSPSQFLRQVQRTRNLDAMIEPHAPELAALEEEFVERLHELKLHAPNRPLLENPARVQYEVERFVYERVEYAWDWDLWGVADYLPTIAEMFAKAAETDGQLREDCDGRALLAASLMRRLGYDARLESDLRHMWVRTSQGAWMGPGDATVVSSSEGGNQIAYAAALQNWPSSLSFGIAVFPLKRELIILLTAFVLLLHPRMSRLAAVIGLILLIQGLLFMRLGYLSPQAVSSQVSSWPAWVGLLHIAAGFVTLLRASHRARRYTTAY